MGNSRFVVLIFAFFFAVPALAETCPTLNDSSLPPLHSKDLQKVQAIQKTFTDETNFHQSQIKKLGQDYRIQGKIYNSYNKKIRAIKKKKKKTKKDRINLKALYSQKRKVYKKIKGINNKLSLANDKGSQAKKSQAKNATLLKKLTKTLQSAETSRRVAICGVDEILQLISQEMIPEFSSLNCQGDVSRLQKLKAEFQKIKNSLAEPKSIDSASRLLSQFHHDNDGLFKTLMDEKGKLNWPSKLEELSNHLAELGKISSVSKNPSLKRLRIATLESLSSFNKMPSDQFCQEVLFNKDSFIAKYKPDLRKLIDSFSKSSDQTKKIKEELISYVNYANYIKKHGRKYVVYMVPPPTLKAIVLYVHWINEPYADVVSSRSEIDSMINNAESAWQEFSYGLFRPSIDVCEVNADLERPTIASGEIIPNMVRLCDPFVDFTQYDWIILYPTASDTAKYLGRRDISTDEGDFEKPIITMTRTPFSDFTLLHEGGHALGLEHAHDVDCGNPTFGGNCWSNDDYGDRFDVMGGNISSNWHYNCIYKTEVGWTTTTILTPGVENYLISATEVNSSLPQCIKVPVDNSLTSGSLEEFHASRTVDEPCDYLAIEYRKPIGTDDFLNNYASQGYYSDMSQGALALHCATDEGGRHTYLLDCTPNSVRNWDPSARANWEEDFKDALLLPSQTCYTGLGFDIQFETFDGDMAEVSITPHNTFTTTAYYVPDEQPDPSCSDTDSGNDPENPGSIEVSRPQEDGTTDFISQSDECSSLSGGSRMQEKRCNEESSSLFQVVPFDCATLGLICVDPDGSGIEPAYCGMGTYTP